MSRTMARHGIAAALLCLGTAASGQESVPLPGFRPDCRPHDAPECWRRYESEFMARWPGVANRLGDTLRLELWRFGVLEVVDWPAPSDQTQLWAFRGVLDEHGLVLLDETRYIGHELWLINSRTFQRQGLPCWVTPSPDERWLFCGEGEWGEEGPAGQVRIYEMAGDSAVLAMAADLGPYRPVDVRWSGEDRVEFRKARLTQYGDLELEQCINTAVHEATGWTVSMCRP